MTFTIEFPGVAQPPAIAIPSGHATLTDDSFHLGVFLGEESATGRIVEIDSLTPVFDITDIITSAHPPQPGWPGSGGTFSWFSQTWDLSSSQRESLIAGQWQAEITIGSEVFVGRLTAVPEPGTVALGLLGLLPLLPLLRAGVPNQSRQATAAPARRQASSVI